MKDKAKIQAKWERKIEEMKKKAEFKYWLELQKKQSQWKKDYEYLTIKINKKRDAYINKKEKEYHRRMLNEIRELEWKPTKEVKKKKNLNLLEFAMSIQQENSKLRDTDEDWNWICCSCGTPCSWENLHWGHFHPRWVKNICLNPMNINAQCKKCNLATWPLWNMDLKMRTQEYYATTIEFKRGKDQLVSLNKLKSDYYKTWYRCDGDYWQWDIPLNKYIPILIAENDRLRSTKKFQPKNNWRKTREKYPELH